jgi:glycosyltransferase involved in cell wall biosynthesis
VPPAQARRMVMSVASSPAGSRRYRVAIVTSHVIQNQDPLFGAIAADPAIELEVLFSSRMGAEAYHDTDLGVELRWDIRMLEGYRHRFLRNFSPGRHGFWRLVNPGVVVALVRGRYDAVAVMGWGSVTTWLAYVTCWLLRRPYFICGDSSFVVERSGFRDRLRGLTLRLLFRKAAGFLVMGTMNGDFYRYYGADVRRFFHFPYAIDNKRFDAASRMTVADRAQERARLGISTHDVVVLFSGKLTALKNPIHLIQALERMKHQARTRVVFMGDGPLRSTVENYVRERGVDGVKFLGFVNQREIPRMYALADLLVLPSSRDHRGTVVNEAMACGLPVVVSDMVGVIGKSDIVRHGENGIVFPVGDIDALAAALDNLVENGELRTRMAARSREIIDTWDFRADVMGLRRALQSLTRVDANGERRPQLPAESPVSGMESGCRR